MIGTYNAGATLAGVIESCAGVDQIVVVDMESTDDTADVARRTGAEVITVPYRGFVEPGRQTGLDAMSTDWVLVLDADEYLVGGVQKVREIVSTAPDETAAFRLPRPTYIGEQRLISSGWGLDYERQARLIRRGRATWPAVVHGVPHFDGRLEEIPDGSPVAIEHRNFADLPDAYARFGRYAAIEAADLVASGEAPSWRGGLEAAVSEFVRRYDPEADGWASLGLSFGIWWYRLSVNLVAGGSMPSSDGLPTAEAMASAWQAFVEALPRTGEAVVEPQAATAAAARVTRLLVELQRERSEVERLRPEVDRLVSEADRLGSEVTRVEQLLRETQLALKAADDREKRARVQLDSYEAEIAVLQARP
jgi:hypothetical protein